MCAVPLRLCVLQVLDGTTIREMLTRRAHVDPSSVPEDSVYYQQFGLPWEVCRPLYMSVRVYVGCWTHGLLVCSERVCSM